MGDKGVKILLERTFENISKEQEKINVFHELKKIEFKNYVLIDETFETLLNLIKKEINKNGESN